MDQYYITTEVQKKKFFNEVFYNLRDSKDNTRITLTQKGMNPSFYPYISWPILSEGKRIGKIERKKFSIMPNFKIIFNGKKLVLIRKWGISPKYFIKGNNWSIESKLVGKYFNRLPTASLAESVPDGFEFTLNDENNQVVANFGLDTDSEEYIFNIDIFNDEYDKTDIFLIILAVYLEIQEVTEIGLTRIMVLKNVG